MRAPSLLTGLLSIQNLNKDIKSFIFLSSLTRFGGSLFNRVAVIGSDHKKNAAKCGGVAVLVALLIFNSLNHFFYPRIEGFFAAGISREFGDDFIVFVGDNIRNRINFECG